MKMVHRRDLKLKSWFLPLRITIVSWGIGRNCVSWNTAWDDQDFVDVDLDEVGMEAAVGCSVISVVAGGEEKEVEADVEELGEASSSPFQLFLKKKKKSLNLISIK